MNNYLEIFNHLNVIIPFTTILIVTIVVAIFKSYNQLKTLFAHDFVTKEACAICVKKIEDNMHSDVKKKYNELVGQIKENAVQRAKEILELKRTHEKLREMFETQIEANARIEAKVDILLEDRKHGH